jgi:hypothetical protein
MFITEPNFFPYRVRFFHPGSATKNFQHFNPKKLLPSSRKYDPGCSSRFWILIFTHPRSRIQGSKRHRNPDPDLQHWKVVHTLLPILSVPVLRSQSRRSRTQIAPQSCSRNYGVRSGSSSATLVEIVLCRVIWPEIS